MTIFDHSRSLATIAQRRRPGDLSARVVELSTRSGRAMLGPIERWIGRSSPIGDTPFYDAKQFPWALELERNWETVLAELNTVLRDRSAIPSFQTISVDQKSLSNDDRWKTYFLF